MLLLLLRAGVWRIMDGLVHCGRIIIVVVIQGDFMAIYCTVHTQSINNINQSINQSR